MTGTGSAIRWSTAVAVIGVAAVAAVVSYEHRWLLVLGIAATLAANVAHGFGHGWAGAVVAAWPAVALVGSYELLMLIIRFAQVPAGREAGPGAPAAGDGPLQSQAAEAFAGGRVADVQMLVLVGFADWSVTAASHPGRAEAQLAAALSRRYRGRAEAR
jgi:hypothetical protein